MILRRRMLAALPLLGIAAVWADTLWVGRFDAATEQLPAPWQVFRFDDHVPATQYRVIRWDGVAAVEARAAASMALLGRPIDIDLGRTPVLCWRWRIDAPLKTADITRKRGDDYAARLYVSFDLPDADLSFATRTKLRLGRLVWGEQLPEAALNYVWDNRSPVGTWRLNAYTDRTQMIVARSGAEDAGRWVEERHDVGADVAHAFGSRAALPIQLAVATDTDNTGESAHAGFADIHFVEADRSCQF